MLKVEGIVDWEYAGFWPEYFETPYFRDPRPSGAQFGDEVENERLVEFLRDVCDQVTEHEFGVKILFTVRG